MKYQDTVKAVNQVIAQYDMPLTLRQIYYRLVAADLIPNPTKIEDPRASGYIEQYGNECWELDAIEPPELVRLCQEAVEEKVDDWDAWNEIKSQDEVEREELRALFEEWKDKY